MGHVMLWTVPSQARLRKVKVGDKMPEFALSDPNGIEFAYRYNRKRVLAIVFLSASQKQSEDTVVDIKRILGDLRGKAEHFPGLYEGDLKPALPMLLDPEYQLWGKLGIIAMPTVVIVGKDDKISWTKAGHGYNFAPSLRSHLSYALGIGGEAAPEESVEVKTLKNTSTRARVKRHLQMAKMLEQKGRLEAAIAEVHKAGELDPNSVEPALELGELLCRAGRNKEALDVAGKLKTTGRLNEARRLLISGWAKRQMGELEAAEKLLLQTTTLDPKSTRALFELGKAYQAGGQTDKAMMAYHRALAQIFGEAQVAKTSYQ
jgi:tetratricopeptide (TPR) repeat protein